MQRSLLLCVALVLSLLPLALSTPSTNLTVGLSTPYGLVYDGQGHLYLSQTNLQSVTKINAVNGAVVSQFNFQSTGLSTPRGLDVDAQGNLYVAQQFNGVGQGFGGYVKFDTQGNVLNSLTGLSQPFGVTTDPQLNVWMANSGDNAAVLYAPNGTVLQRSPPGVIYSPHGIVSDAAGVLYIMSFPTSEIGSAYITRRAVNGTYTVFATGFTYPEDLVIDCQGNLYVADTMQNRVVKLSPTGAQMAIFTPQDVPFNAVTGVALDEYGTLYATDYNNGRIVRFAGATTACPAIGKPSSSSTGAAVVVNTAAASLCYITYGLPGTIDYPWSQAISLNIQYNTAVVNTAFGPAVKIVSGVGSRVFTNKFDTQTTQSVTVTQATSDLLYLTSQFAVDASGITVMLPGAGVQMPGQNPTTLFASIDIFNGSYAILSGPAASVDPQGTAFVSNIPGFVNKTVGPANLNALSINYQTCVADINFSNGVRAPNQANANNNARNLQYSYTLTDGATYSVFTNLTLTATTQFAQFFDQLGNQYQIIANISGTRTFTALPSGAVTTATVTARNINGVGRFYPFSFISSSPGVYTPSTAPFLDAAGLTYTVSVGTPASTVTVFQATNLQTGATLLQESNLPAPIASLSQQTYTLLPGQ